MSRHTTAHHFLEGLVDLGVDYIFANLGTDHVSLIEEMARWDQEGRKHPEMILCPHEVVAVHMAGGYALATGTRPGGSRACRCRHRQRLHGDPEPVSIPVAGDAVCRTRTLHAAWRTAGIARYLRSFRAGPVRHRQHRQALRQMGIFAALRRRGEGGAGPRQRVRAKRSARPCLHDAAARNAGRTMGRRRHAGLSARAVWRRAHRRHRAGAGRCHRASIDGGGKSDRADGLSRPQAASRRGAGPAGADLRHPGRGIQFDRPQYLAGLALLRRLRSAAPAGDSRSRPAARFGRAVHSAIRQACRRDQMDPDRHRSLEVGFSDVGISDRHADSRRLRHRAAAGARRGGGARR